jgi:endonuclease YncB( thermonuclease family)
MLVVTICKPTPTAVKDFCGSFRDDLEQGVTPVPRKERVTAVIDGDTFRTASRKNPVRLANVDAPERSQRGGAAATEALRRLIKGETVTIDPVARDVYGRTVANVKLGRQSVNKTMREKVR